MQLVGGKPPLGTSKSFQYLEHWPIEDDMGFLRGVGGVEVRQT